MTIFKFEMKRHLKYILGWTIALAVCIFLMTPVYYSFMEAAESTPLYDTLGKNDFFKSVGISMGYLTTPLGIYSFLTSFFMLASGIYGLHFGITIHTKEFSGKTSEYLYTKPHTRKEIFLAKAGTVFAGVLITGIAYAAASAMTLFLFCSKIPWGEFFLISLSLLWLTLLMAAMGLLLGIIFSNNRNPLLTVGLIVFVEYCITSFSNVIVSRAISYLSPFSFFSGARIAQNGFYETDYMICYLVLFVLFVLISYQHFIKKDFRFRA
ncbi:MAG: ABC transporter permease subunit [Lachnospiraceae bacterium]|nr:ABC transporter permease subunit [Lachnospiraceae bacterium]